MTVSFIIPVYNCKMYLRDCVDSIRNAAIPDYEILLIDDGSTDGSGSLCDELAQEDPRIRAIHQCNAGVSAARNKGIQEACGEKILFIDSDDSVDPTELARVLLDSRCDQSELTIFGMTFDYYRKGQCYRQDSLFFEREETMTRDQWGAVFADLYDHNSLSPLWNKVFRKSILKKYELRLNEDMFLYEDFEFTLRYMRHCDSVWNVPRAIYHYRQSEDEGNARRRLARIESISAFLEPIELAMSQIARENAAIGSEQRDRILQKLYLVLAREKITGSNLEQIRTICREYRCWVEKRELPLRISKFQEHLLENRAILLWLSDKKTMIRHKIAVWVKAQVHKIRSNK